MTKIIGYKLVIVSCSWSFRRMAGGFIGKDVIFFRVMKICQIFGICLAFNMLISEILPHRHKVHIDRHKEKKKDFSVILCIYYVYAVKKESP